MFEIINPIIIGFPKTNEKILTIRGYKGKNAVFESFPGI
jgi:hypothetical protein